MHGTRHILKKILGIVRSSELLKRTFRKIKNFFVCVRNTIDTRTIMIQVKVPVQVPRTGNCTVDLRNFRIENEIFFT